MKPAAAVEGSVSFATLLAYTSLERDRWHEFFRQHPDALKVAFGAEPVGGMVLHIFAAEVRLAERLSGASPTPFPEFTNQSADELFAFGHQARAVLESAIADLAPADYDQMIEMNIGASLRRFSKRKVVIQTMLHPVHHWGQIATVLRQAGYKTWVHDFLMSSAID
jgi:uncharacterized damage-inducible protein DinB